MSDTENEEYFDDGVEAEPLSEGDSDPFSQLEAFIFAKCSQRKNFVKVDAEDEYQEPGPSPTTTPSKKDMVYKKYQLHPVEELCKIAERMHKTSAVSGEQFLKRMLELDQRRGETFSNTHQEIFTAMGGVL